MVDKRITAEQRKAIKKTRKIAKGLGAEGQKIRTASRQTREQFSYSR